MDALNERHSRYVKSEPYEIVPEFEPDTGWHTIYVVAEPVPPIIGVLVGEAAHQLRSVLDNLAWQLANVNGPPPFPDKVMFPIMSRQPKVFARANAVNGMRSQHKTILEDFQPYKTRKSPSDFELLERLAWIDNTDKHKLVHTVASLAEDIAPQTLQAYEGYRLAGSEFVEGRIMLEGKTYIGRVCVRPTKPDLQMHMQGAIDLGVAFGDPNSPLYGAHADGTLRLLEELVEMMVGLFDRPGQNGSPPWP
jgi:hypothetical protein